MINGGIINFNGGAGGSGGSSSGVTNLGVTGGADLTGAVDLSAPSGFVVLGDDGGSSPITIAIDVHAMSGLWGLSPGGGGGAIDSVGVLGGADLTGDIDFTDPSGFIVWGDSAGSSPITASVDTHALSGLWDLNQININKSNLAASGQVILNELAVSGQVLLTEINTKADQADLDASGQVLLSNDAASGQVLWSELKGSGQLLLSENNASGQYLQNILNVSGQVLLGNDNASGQYLWSELKGSGQLLLGDTAASGQLLVPNQDCDWNGFPNRSDCTIDFDHTTRTLSIQPTGSQFAYYIGCTQYLSNGDTFVIPNTEGVHYIYYDGPTLTGVVNPTIGDTSILIRTKALVSAIYWGTNQASGLYIGEERHGMSMSPVTHAYLHFINGLEYTTGLGLNNITAEGNGDADDHAVFGVDSGAVSDEDIYLNIDAVPSGEGLPVYYMTGSTPNWNKVDPSGFSVRTFDQTRNTRLAYNQNVGGTWQLTEVDNLDFVLCHVFATTEKDKPMIAVMGQAEYDNIIQARTGASVEILSLITNDLLFPEIRPIATVIYQTSNGYDNQVKARIRTTDEGDNYIDWRSEEISRVAVSTSDHNALSNLQGGIAGQYYHLTEAERDNVITLPASGQVLLNELAVSGQVLLGNDAASGQVLLTENNASGQYLWNVVNVSGQTLMSEIASSGQTLLTALNVSGQVLLENTASSGQVLLTEIGNISGITSEGMMVLNAAQSATISGQDVYIRAGAHAGFGSIHNRCRNSYIIGDQSSNPKDDEGTPWDVIAFARHGIYLRPDTYFVIGDGTQGQWSPVDIFLYSGDTIKLFPSGTMEIGNSNFIDNTPDNINFYAEDGFKARIKNTYGNNYEYGVDVSSDNVALTTVPGNRPTINTSGIALLDDVLGSGQAVVTSIGIIGDNDLHGDVDFQTKASGFMGIIRTGKELPNTIRITDSDVVLYYYFDSAPTSGVAIPNRATAADPNTDLDWYSIPGGNYFDGAGLYGAEVTTAVDPDGLPLQWGGRNPYAASGNLSYVAAQDIAYYDKWRNIANWEANNISAALSSGDFSFGMWFKAVEQNNDIVNAALLNFASSLTSLNYGYYLDIQTDGVMNFRRQDNGTTAIISSDTAVSGAAGAGEAYWSAWNHLTITVSRTADGDGKYAYFYLNGLEVGNSDDAQWPDVYSAENAPRYLVLGGIARNLTYYDSSFAFRDFWIMDRAISEGEVGYIFNNDIAKEALVANDLQFNVDHNALSGLWQLDRIVQNAEDLKGSGQLLLTENNASGQYLWNTLNVSGQTLLGNDAASGQVVLNELNVSGQVLLQQAGGVSSIGALGGADLTGAVDFSDPSGFIVWGDDGGASPVTASIDVHALSGLWSLGNVGSYRETISVAASTWTITHGLNSKDLLITLWDNNDFAIEADSIKKDSNDQVTIEFTSSTAGRVEIISIGGNAGAGGGGGGDVASVGVEGGAALTGAIEFTTPSGFIVWGDTAGANPITADFDYAALSGLYKNADAYIYLQGSAAALNPTSGATYTTLNLLSEGSMYRFKKNFYHINDTQNVYFGLSGIYAITACLGTNHNVVATQNGIIGHYSVATNTYAQIGNSLRQMQVATSAANQIVINYLLRAEAGDFINFQGSFSNPDPGSLYLPNQVGVTIHRVCEGDILLERVLP